MCERMVVLWVVSVVFIEMICVRACVSVCVSVCARAGVCLGACVLVCLLRMCVVRARGCCVVVFVGSIQPYN